jgi:Leu/Phe-tRNA-protein transferase
MATLREQLEHVKHHIKYPASRSEVVAACNAMEDLPEDREWISKNLPEGRYDSPVEVLKALLNRV